MENCCRRSNLPATTREHGGNISGCSALRGIFVFLDVNPIACHERTSSRVGRRASRAHEEQARSVGREKELSTRKAVLCYIPRYRPGSGSLRSGHRACARLLLAFSGLLLIDGSEVLTYIRCHARRIFTNRKPRPHFASRCQTSSRTS